MPPCDLAPLSGRYLSFAECEEIALLRAQDHCIREIARRIGRDASTVSRELRRNAATRGGNTSAAFALWCKENHIDRSMGRTGVCWDNAAAESFFGSLKNECCHQRTFATRTEARLAVADYIEVFYN
jgi:transposase InsO family protein